MPLIPNRHTPCVAIDYPRQGAYIVQASRSGVIGSRLPPLAQQPHEVVRTEKPIGIGYSTSLEAVSRLGRQRLMTGLQRASLPYSPRVLRETETGSSIATCRSTKIDQVSLDLFSITLVDSHGRHAAYGLPQSTSIAAWAQPS